MNDKQRLATPQAELVPQRPSPTLAARTNQIARRKLLHNTLVVDKGI
jgi:hypothetical protein